MITKKSMCVLFGILVISAWILGPAIQVGAETLNYKFYSYVIKSEGFPIGDVEGHAVGLTLRSAFYVLENGEVATAYEVSTSDTIKEGGSFSQYVALTFPDGSTITIKSQGTLGAYGAPGGSGGWTTEIIKGTGRFEGIKGTHNAKGKFLPVEKWEAGPKVIGEGTYTYTLPSK